MKTLFSISAIVLMAAACGQTNQANVSSDTQTSMFNKSENVDAYACTLALENKDGTLEESKAEIRGVETIVELNLPKTEQLGAKVQIAETGYLTLYIQEDGTTKATTVVSGSPKSVNLASYGNSSGNAFLDCQKLSK